VRWSCHGHNQEGGAAVLLVIKKGLERVHCRSKAQRDAIFVGGLCSVLLEGSPVLDITDVAITCEQNCTAKLQHDQSSTELN
jgi:hypothetical protein